MTATAAAPTRRRRLLVPLATLVAATGIAIASGATFTASTASTGLVASGTLAQVNSNTVAFTKDNLKPGDVVVGTVTITNSGSLPAEFTLTETQVENTFAPKTDLTLSITEDGTEIYKGTLGAAAPITLADFEAGEDRSYVYTVTFNAAATNAQQNKVARTTYTFDSVQTEAETHTPTQSGDVTDTAATPAA